MTATLHFHPSLSQERLRRWWSLLTVHSAVEGLEMRVPPVDDHQQQTLPYRGDNKSALPGWQEKARIAGNDHGCAMVQYRVSESNPRNLRKHSAYIHMTMWCDVLLYFRLPMIDWLDWQEHAVSTTSAGNLYRVDAEHRIAWRLDSIYLGQVTQWNIYDIESQFEGGYTALVFSIPPVTWHYE